MNAAARPSDILVIGGGLAATALVASLRGRDYDGQVIVASEELELPYDRPPLTKELLTRDAPASLLAEFGLDENSATWLLGARARTIRPHGHMGAEVEFEVSDGPAERATIISPAVVIATGSRPVLPAPLQGALTVSTWDDAEQLRRTLTPGSSLAIVGGGWIGLELASVAQAAGVTVDVFDTLGSPLGRFLPADVGHRLSGNLTFHGGRTVAAVRAGGIELATGERHAADVVVAAVGAAPVAAWLPAEWCDETGRVRLDERGEVRGAPGVWAIGDVASAHQHWNSAVASAERAAAAILGAELPPVATPHVFSRILGRDVDVFGWPTPDADVVWREEPGSGTWTALLHEGDVLTSGVVVGRPRDAAALRRLLAAGPVRLDVTALADPAAPLPRP